MSAKDFSLAMGEISDKYINEAINYTATSKSKRAAVWHFPLSKHAVAIIAVIVVLSTTVFSVEAIREPIVKFFVEVYETYIEYTFEGDKSETITKEYRLSDVPDGFTQTDYFKEDAIISATYKNENGDTIAFKQSVTTDTALSVDNEHLAIEIVEVAGREVRLHTDDDVIVAIWLEDTYMFEIFCNGNFDKEIMIALIEAVQ